MRAEEIDRAHHQERKDDGDLRIAGGEKRQSLPPAHDFVPVAHDRCEPVAEPRPFRFLAREQGHFLGVLAQPHQREAEIGLVALLIEIELDEGTPDDMGHPRAENGVDQRGPDQIAGNLERLRPDDQRRRRRQGPQDHDEGHERDDRAEERDADIERVVDEFADVVGDALIGVVGLIALEPHAVMRALAEPAPEIALGQPIAPADLQPLLQIELIDGADDEEGGKQAEHPDLPDEGVPVLVLQRRVEGVVPGVELDVQPDLEQLERDHGREEHAPGPAVLGPEIGEGDAGEVFVRGLEIRHS